MQVTQRLHEGRHNVGFAMLVVPQLGGDPQILAPHATGHNLLQGRPDQMFIAIDRCAVKVPVADRRRALYRFGNLRAGDVVRAEGAKPKSGHFCAGVEAALRNGLRVYAVAGRAGVR